MFRRCVWRALLIHQRIHVYILYKRRFAGFFDTLPFEKKEAPGKVPKASLMNGPA